MAFKLVNVSEEVINQLEEAYEKDENFQKLVEKPEDTYRKIGKRLYFDKRLCVPKGKIRQTILHDNHESLLGAYRGSKKTLSLISRHCYWPGMKEEVYEYVKTCQKCQEAKSLNQNRLGYLRPFPPPQRKWEVISMAFIFNLPKTAEEKTAILVVVDKLSKRIHLIPLESDNNTQKIAEAFYTEIYKHHGLPRKIISDRDSRFTGSFWSELMRILKVKLNFPTSFHPQTDGQSE